MNPSSLFPSLLAQVEETKSWLRPSAFAEWFADLAPWINVPIVLLLVFALPFFLGWAWAKYLRMPTYGWRLGLILCTIFASLATISLGWPPRLGVDLKGGYIMIWQIDRSDSADVNANVPATLDGGDTSGRAGLIDQLKRRLNPDGLKELSIRPYGLDEIEIIVPETDKAEIDKLKRQITDQGVLNFMIVAERNRETTLFELAEKQARDPATRRQRNVRGEGISGRWAQVGRDEIKRGGVYPVRLSGGWGSYLVRNAATGELIDGSLIPGGEVAAAKYLEREKIAEVDVLLKQSLDYPVTGKDLRSGGAIAGIDENGYPEVRFEFNPAGAPLMGGLTSTHIGRQLAIVLDDRLLSAANIKSQITDSGRITGRFSQAEVDYVIRILKAGSLDVRLMQEPVYEDISDPTLGAENIRQGAIAIVVSLMIVFVFCLVYYRYAGIVACIALAMNILLTIGVMILFGATLTMPGLAGMVLTVGMSVDANVLIFERIREELAKGSALRMAIRNGFDRAMSTIIDSNLTTLLTAIILYIIGTDQLVGFAVTLTLGILISMFTAIFVSRTIFEIWERTGVVRSLSFMQFLTKTNYDFVRYMGTAVVISCLLIGIGLAAALWRGQGIFDIDLRGGSSVQLVLNEPMTSGEMNTLVNQAFAGKDYEGSQIQPSVKPVGEAKNGMYDSFRVDTIIPDTNEVEGRLKESLQKNGESLLKHYRVSFDTPSGEKQSSVMRDESAFFTALNQNADEAAEPTTDAVDSDAVDSEAVAPDAPKVDAKIADDGDTLKTTTDDAEKAPLATLPKVTSTLEFTDSTGKDEGITSASLRTRLEEAAQKRKIEAVDIEVTHPQWNGDPEVRRTNWNVALSTTPADAEKILRQLQETVDGQPLWPASKKIGGQIAGNFVRIAIVALITSLLGIIAYIWFRFQNVAWGLAAVLALIHDVLFMLAGIAVSYWLSGAPAFTGLTEFKIDLTVIAAFLTLIGYSINDTIVIFDRMREIKGKLPYINRQIVNDGINQTLSRSILTFLTTFVVVSILFAFGGPGIHAFAFAMLIGTFVGMYSTVFIAAPFLLWMINRNVAKKPA